MTYALLTRSSITHNHAELLCYTLCGLANFNHGLFSLPCLSVSPFFLPFLSPSLCLLYSRSRIRLQKLVSNCVGLTYSTRSICACVRACVRACVCACVCVCFRTKSIHYYSKTTVSSSEIKTLVDFPRKTNRNCVAPPFHLAVAVLSSSIPTSQALLPYRSPQHPYPLWPHTGPIQHLRPAVRHPQEETYVL